MRVVSAAILVSSRAADPSSLLAVLSIDSFPSWTSLSPMPLSCSCNHLVTVLLSLSSPSTKSFFVFEWYWPLASSQSVLSYYTRHSMLHRSEEHTSELQSHLNIICRLLLEKINSPSAFKTLTSFF